MISIIEKLEMKVPLAVQIAPNTMMPMHWQSLAIWVLDQSEVGEYEQMTDLVVEDGTVAAYTEPKTLENTKPGSTTGAKIISTLTAIPITQGPLRLRLFYKKITEQQWTLAAEYPIEMVLIRQ